MNDITKLLECPKATHFTGELHIHRSPANTRKLLARGQASEADTGENCCNQMHSLTNFGFGAASLYSGCRLGYEHQRGHLTSASPEPLYSPLRLHLLKRQSELAAHVYVPAVARLGGLDPAVRGRPLHPDRLSFEMKVIPFHSERFAKPHPDPAEEEKQK